MPICLENIRLITPTKIVDQGIVIISDRGKIRYAGSRAGVSEIPAERFDLGNRFVIPGLVDIHVHGGGGITFGDLPAEEGLQTYSHWVTASGVTGFLCSIAAPDADSLITLIEEYVSVLEAGLRGAEGLGLHLEGPYLNPEKKGAFNPAWLRTPSASEATRFLEAGRGWIKQVTLAPELPGADEVAFLFQKAGVTTALGHTNATYEQVQEACQKGFAHVTHTFNAQGGFDHRQPGVLGAILSSDRITTELIADLVHVHPAAIKTLFRCVGTERITLITDAMSGAGLADGIYQLVGHTIIVKQGKATLENGTIAGSTALLNQCVRNIHTVLGVPLPVAVKMASLNPARVIHLSNRIGSLATGKDANLAVIDSEVNVLMTVVKGKIVYNRLQG